MFNLITGGAGFIGSNIAKELNKLGEKVIIFGHISNFINLVDINNEIPFIILEGDINSKEDLEMLNQFKIKKIFHQAAISSTINENNKDVIRTNVNSFLSIIEIAKKNKCPLYYASSSAQYGNDNKPENIYGFSKMIMDNVAKSFQNEITIVGLRYFNVYGYGEHHKGKSSSMVYQWIKDLSQNCSPVAFKDSYETFRDFIYIDDVVKANLMTLESGIYEVGTAESISFGQILDEIKLQLNKNCSIIKVDNPYKSNGYQKFTQAKNSIITNPINYKDGINKYIKILKEKGEI